MFSKSVIVSTKIIAAGVMLSVVVFGCSAKDKPTYTPVFHVGTMTNSSSVNSWELYTDPMHTQPGAYHGAPAIMRTVPSLRGFEPYDPLAVKVFTAISTDASVNTRYMSAGAKDGIVALVGTVPNKSMRDQAVSDARKVDGVHQVRDLIAIQPATT